MIDINNVTFGYKKSRKVLEDFTLRIAEGGIYGLLGKNGTGKSTLLYLIAGLLTAQHGTIEINGANARQRRPSILSDLFLVPEEFGLPSVSMVDYIASNSPFYPNFSYDDLRRNLEIFDMTMEMHLGELSMGQKKKAFMCFALACNTPILLLDEPTNGLDIPGKSRFRQFIVGAMNDERTVIISTHQVRDIDRILDHIIITDSKRMVLDSSVADVLSTFKFGTGVGKEEAAEALYARPSIEGFETIAKNTDGVDTELNLELLFEYVTSTNHSES